MTDLDALAVVLTVVGLLTAASVVFSRLFSRTGLPVVLLFLALGMVGGSEGPGGVDFEDYALAAEVGTVALVLILFDGGLNTSAAGVRAVWRPALLLATLGVVVTAGVTAGVARLFGIGWGGALLLGAVVSSTDAAAVFAVLRGGGLNLRRRLGRTIEVESCVNDPMAVILTATMIGVVIDGRPPGWSLAWTIPVQLAVGGVVGVAAGLAGAWVLRRVRLTTVGLYPALTISLALVAYGAATLLSGSGLLAVYAAAVALGNAAGVPYRSGLVRVHDAVAWQCQIGMFLMLGLLVTPSALPEVLWPGLTLGLALGLVARPIAVVACLWPFGYPRAEVGYVGLVGLRGAVPIILATFPLLAGVPDAGRLFHLVFFIVVVSSLVPGALIRPLTTWLRLTAPEKPAPPAVLEILSASPLRGELTSYYIEPSVAVCGAKLSEVELPDGAGVVLVVRGPDLVAARGATVLQPGDHAYVFSRSEDAGLIGLLFGRTEDAGAE